MLRFVIHKILKKKWMMLALLVGNILLIGVTVSNPLYEQAILQRMLTRNLSNYMVEHNAYPGVTSVTAVVNGTKYHEILDKAGLVGKIPERMGIGAICEVSRYSTSEVKVVPELERDDDQSGKHIKISTMSGISGHTRMIAGRMFESEPDARGIVDVIVSESGLLKMNLLLDEIITIPEIHSLEGKPLKLRVAGVFTNSIPDDVYWVSTPQSYTDQVFMAEPVFMDLFASKPDSNYFLKGTWYTLLDYTAVQRESVEKILAVSRELEREFSLSQVDTYSDNFSDILSDFLIEEKKFNVTLWSLQIPIYVLLAAFIFIVSRQTLETEQSEISVLKSRGASKRQLITIYLVQSMVMALAGFLLGIPLGAFLCQVLGASNAFLEFVQRKTLEIQWNAEAFLYALAAAVISVSAMVLPVFRFSGVTIVALKQNKNRRSAAPWWQKSFLDVALLGVSLYGLYTFSLQKDLIVRRVAAGEALDPLLFLSSSLFMLGAGLVALRILPLITWVIYRLFKRWWSPALTASFLHVIRSKSNRGFITVFIVLTIAMGIFNAQAARTINSNREDNIRYAVGADVTVQEVWPSIMSANLKRTFFEPDFGRYKTLLENGAEQITKVFVDDDVTLSLNKGTLRGVRLMGIHTREFGETVWFRNFLLPQHINQYLNAMSQDARAVLVSKNLETDYDYKIGDMLYYKNKDGDMAQGIICGFVDYWPSYAPMKNILGEDGVYSEEPQYLIVTHLSLLQSAWGITPYQIWMKIPGSSQIIYDFAKQSGIKFEKFSDASAMIEALKNNPVFQGTNGVLTIEFIVALLLCSVGFLIYWILSIRARSLQFGIFRAMGMSIREVITMLINEQIFISVLAIATGVLVGNLASRFFIPLILIAYTAVDQALPTVVAAAYSDAVRLMLVVGSMMLLCMAILAMIVRSLKIAQVLKLGED